MLASNVDFKMFLQTHGSESITKVLRKKDNTWMGVLKRSQEDQWGFFFFLTQVARDKKSEEYV